MLEILPIVQGRGPIILGQNRAQLDFFDWFLRDVRNECSRVLFDFVSSYRTFSDNILGMLHLLLGSPKIR